MSKLGALHVSQITGARHTATVIFFHGSGGTGETMKEWVKLLVKKPFEFPHIKVLYPTAPLQPYTPAGGQLSNVWFDRQYISPQADENNESLQNIATEVKRIIKQENDLGIPNNRIIVGGFSMGGALAYHVGYRWEKSVAGVFTFSSFLNDKSAVYKELSENKSEYIAPLLKLHGNNDDLVFLEWGKKTFHRLKELNVNGEFHELDKLGHSLNKRGLEIIRDWIEKRLPENAE